MSEWQLIETAPKDGTEIQLWTVLKKDGQGQWWPEAAWETFRGDSWWMVKDSEGEGFLSKAAWRPTHWMPQPPAPNA